MRTTLLVAALGLFALGCRSDDPKMMGDDAPPIDAPPGTDDVRIQDMQTGVIAPDTAVKLEGVIVTGIDTYGSRTGEFYVQEPEGGAHSGIKVFNAPLDQVSTLQIGDVVTITGATYVEYRYEPMMGTPWPEGVSLSELVPTAGGAMTVTKTGMGTPVATDVDALAIEMLATPEERDAEWEKWEGVLVNVRKARQTTEVTTFGAGADDQKSFRATGRLEVQSAMSPLGAVAVIDTCYESLVGVVDYFFSYKLAPRMESDLVGGGTGCAEVVAQDATIVEIQTGAVAGEVRITNAVVTGLYSVGNNRGFWIADAAQAAPNNGVMVYTSNTAVTYAIGDVVTVRGVVDEFDLGSGGMPAMGNTITQVEMPVHMAGTGGPMPPLPVTATVLEAGDIGDPGEKYEGVLIKIEGVRVTNTMAGGSGQNVRVELTDRSGKTIQMARDAFQYTAPAMDTCYKSVTGIGSVAIFDDKRTIAPRGTGDFEAGILAVDCAPL